MSPMGRERGGAAAPSIVVVEDDPTIRELLSASLRFAGFTVATAATGEEAIECALRQPPDLVVLDVMLPGMDGFEVVRKLREHSWTTADGRLPVLFLTARDATDDKVSGLTAGGDDYVTKPFSVEELIARIHAVLRRTGRGTEDAHLTVGDLELDPQDHQVHRAGRAITLSPTEFALLRYLMENVDRTVSKRQIVDRVWRHDFGGDVGVVESYVSYLRRKVDTAEPKLIHTVRGVGYVLRRPAS